MLGYHRRPPNVGRLLARVATLLAGWCVVLGLVVLMFPEEQRHDMVVLSIGILAGFCGTGLASIRMLKSSWPVYEAVTDWERAASIDAANRPGG